MSADLAAEFQLNEQIIHKAIQKLKSVMEIRVFALIWSSVIQLHGD